MNSNLSHECFICGKIVDLVLESIYSITISGYVYGSACKACAENAARKIFDIPKEQTEN